MPPRAATVTVLLRTPRAMRVALELMEELEQERREARRKRDDEARARRASGSTTAVSAPKSPR